MLEDLDKRQGLFLPQAFMEAQKVKQERLRKTATYNLKRFCTDLIQQHYPEHLFTVEIEPVHGNIIIDHPLLANAEARYFCRYSDFEQTNGRAVVKLAGEILERVNMPRSELKYYEDYDDVRVVEASKTAFNSR